MSDPIKQKNRILNLETSLGKDELILNKFIGFESISKLFHFNISMFSQNLSIKPNQLIGKPITFSINRDNTPVRYFHGIINKFYAGPREFQGGREYRAEVVPWLWFLNRTTDCRIFQNLTIKDIVTTIFQEYGLNDYSLGGITSSHKPRPYCVQYNETAFNFITRLLEEEGIYYFFEHHQDKHVLILGDGDSCFKNTNWKTIYNQSNYPSDCINQWEHQYSFGSGKWTYNSYDFEAPNNDMIKTTQTLINYSFEKKYEFYKFAGGSDTVRDGTVQSKLLMEAEDSQCETISGAGTYPNFVPGSKFKNMTSELDSEQDLYVLVEVLHEAYDSSHYPGESDKLKTEVKKPYSNQFTCIPASVTFRPQRLISKPSIHGLQTAVVVGPEGEEIYTDKYGRIKVRFHWDRKGKEQKEDSSCWIRLAQTWAGKRWGTIFIPRVGQEVVISFIDGDPDQPLVVGSVYNFDQMPPYELPTNSTQSGLKSHSSKNGAVDDANELRFEDKKGDEQIYLHAQKDLHSVIENDELLEVKHNQTIQVKNDRLITIEEGNEKREIKKGNHDLTIASGDDKRTIEKGNRNVKVSSGDDTLEISQGNHEIKVTSGKSSLEAMQSIEFKVGSNSILIDQSGITLKGINVSVNGTIIQIKADTSLKFESIMVEGNGSGMLKLQGALTMIN